MKSFRNIGEILRGEIFHEIFSKYWEIFETFEIIWICKLNT